ncbi:MAG: hypothetical protein HW421_4163, partial [Ignavibacteria bacterium]|nr:hypothetical protein [Ignavibacteria bacterium]
EMEIAKIVTGGYIVWNYKKHYKKIYDYLGNVIAEIPNEVKKAYVSPDGKAVLYQYDIGKNR